MSTVSNTTGGARRRTVKRRPTIRRPSSKTAHKGQRKLKSKTKAKRKTRSRTTSMSSKYSGGARRKAARRSSSSHSRRSRGHSESVKELAFMGNDRLRLGLVPPLPLQLALDPELKRKVQMSDPRVRDIFTHYGPGWTGYEIGVQSGRKKRTVQWERKIEGFPAAALHPLMHPMHPGNMGALGLSVPAGFVGPDGKRQDLEALAVESSLVTTVKSLDKDRLPGDNFNVKSYDVFGLGPPEVVRVAGIEKKGKMPKVN